MHPSLFFLYTASLNFPVSASAPSIVIVQVVNEFSSLDKLHPFIAPFDELDVISPFQFPISPMLLDDDDNDEREYCFDLLTFFVGSMKNVLSNVEKANEWVT